MAYRPPSRSNRPSSGLRTNNRPSTGFRRLDTANGLKPVGSRTVGLDTNVQIEHRPITQHGMTGMKSVSRGPTRKIADRNYYEQQLKQKLVEIDDEIDGMNDAMQHSERNKARMTKMEKEQNALLTEVREYEGNLADYNLALDKLRSGADIESLQQMCHEIETRNEQEKMRVDGMYMERKNLEHQIAEIESDMASVYDEMVTSIPDRHAEIYDEFEKANFLIAEKKKNLSEIQYRYQEIRHSLSSNEYAYHLKAMELEKRVVALKSAKLELERETNGSLDPEQLKRNLLDKVKNDNQVLQQTMDAMSALEERMENAQNALISKEKELESLKEFNQNSHKYQQLFERDRKMQSFLGSFDENLSDIKRQVEALRQDNVGLLRHISTEQEQQNMSADILGGHHGKQQGKNETASATAVHVVCTAVELKKKRIELDKINNLEKKIQTELQNIEKQRNSYADQMASFKSHHEIESDFKQSKQLLFKSRMDAQQEKEDMEKKVLEMAQKCDELNRKLSKDPYHRQLKEMEDKIEKLSQNIFSVEDSIADHKRKGQYKNICESVIFTQHQINALLIKEMIV